MPSRVADVVVIGAGIIGCSIAYNLASRGVRDVVMVEQNEIASGATAAAAGGIRLQFSTEANVRLSIVSLRIWERFSETFGVDIGFRQQGYLFLLRNPRDAKAFKANVALQQPLGAPVRWVSTDEIHEINPFLRLGDVIGGTFCPLDGWADTYSATVGFANAAKRLGVTILRHTPVTGIRTHHRQVQAVETPSGTIATNFVINAAGAQSREIGLLVGVDVPVMPVRRMSFVTAPFDNLPQSLPMTVDFDRSLYFHPENPGFLFGMSNPAEPSSTNTSVDPTWMLRTIEELSTLVPAFEDARVLRGWAGSYEVTPDNNPVLGFIAEIDGFFVASGFSGHGFMQGPAIGICVAELITTGRASTVNIDEFSPARFQQEAVLREYNVI